MTNRAAGTAGSPLRTTGVALRLCLTPNGHPVLVSENDAPDLDPTLAGRLRTAFARGGGYGLLQFGAGKVGVALPPVFAYWRELGGRYATAICTRPESEGGSGRVPPPAEVELEGIAAAAPMMAGGELRKPF